MNRRRGPGFEPGQFMAQLGINSVKEMSKEFLMPMTGAEFLGH